MLTTIRDAMIDALEDLSLFKKVDVWKGELPDLKMQAKSLPSAYVALTSGEYSKIKTMPPRDANLVMQWDVLVFMRGLSASSLSDTASGYELIEAVSAKASDGGLSGMVASGGLLWPNSLDLVSAEDGVIVYRIGFSIECQVPALETPTT
jgi:hypothetical protein